MTKKNEQAPKPAKNATLPEWVTKGTMQEPDYTLEVTCGCGACSVDAIYITREEYLALKLHLATLRGFPIAACKAVIDEDRNDITLKIHAA